MWQTLHSLKDSAKAHKDADNLSLLEIAQDLWTRTIVEQHDHEEKCRANIGAMQQESSEWLQELGTLLVNDNTSR